MAVEVRRLNQHEQTAGGNRGITAIPTWQFLESFIRTIGPSGTDESWFVYVRILRSPARPKAQNVALSGAPVRQLMLILDSLRPAI